MYAASPANVRKFYFEATNEDDAESWRRDIAKAIEGSEGKQYPLSYLTSLPEYWRVSLYRIVQTASITEDEFAKTCDSGDILLFRSTHTGAKLQRAITSSEYGESISHTDHVAVVLKNQRN